MSATAAPAGPTLYVTNGNSDNIAIFTITDTGDLIPLGDPVPTADQPRSMVFSPGGDFLYVENGDAHQVSTYKVDSRGRLTLRQKIETAGYPFGIALSPRGDAVFVTNLNDPPSVSSFAVRYDGTLEPIGEPVPVGNGALSARGVAVSTDGRFVFVGTGDPFSPDPGELTTFAVRADHTLEFRSSAPAGAGALGIGVAPNGRFVYLACGVSDEIMPFKIGHDGRLTPLPVVRAPDLPVSAEISRDGKFLFATSHGDNTGTTKGVRVFKIQADGTLRPVASDPTPAGGTPVWPALTPDGRHLYVTNEDTSGEVFGFEKSNTGALSPLANSPFDARGQFSMFQSVAVRG
ncbi:lactonase family protein [Amycolatopsis anabasis]|uniref:lactonase family protein n=1 Tax=Amycolatopsis anabasis TaxID=1840409 RepID=UPI00131E93B6|nr:beta-propeller fold lactonase family protein [Amycolatopsis anabasis]